MELYDERVKEFGKRMADLKFIRDVLLLFRPGIIRPMDGNKNLNSYGMYKSYFTIVWRNLWSTIGCSAISARYGELHAGSAILHERKLS